jgi:hypothetical protein
VLHGVDRATITRAVHEIRPLLAKRGFAIPGMPGVRLRTGTGNAAERDFLRCHEVLTGGR